MKLFLAIIFGIFTYSALALDDTTANRQQQADRLCQIRPIKEEMEVYVANLTKKMLPSRQQYYKDLYLKYLDYDALEKIRKDYYVTYFTADELKGLADFTSTPAGKSIMNKMELTESNLFSSLKGELEKAKLKMQESGK
jgi:hypothetical protein